MLCVLPLISRACVRPRGSGGENSARSGEFRESEDFGEFLVVVDGLQIAVSAGLDAAAGLAQAFTQFRYSVSKTTEVGLRALVAQRAKAWELVRRLDAVSEEPSLQAQAARCYTLLEYNVKQIAEAQSGSRDQLFWLIRLWL